MTSRAAELLGRPLEELKIVSLMLGSGCTANACKGGKSVEVSTGLTPTEGLIQSTRCGDIDPLAVTYLMRKEGLTPQQMDEILNRESGWLGISQVSNDMREVEAAARAGHRQAQLAIEAFTHRCRKYIGAYAAAMGGIDVLVFSGGLGEKSPTLRTQICAGLEFLGIMIDPERNREAAKDCLISPIMVSQRPGDPHRRRTGHRPKHTFGQSILIGRIISSEGLGLDPSVLPSPFLAPPCTIFSLLKLPGFPLCYPGPCTDGINRTERYSSAHPGPIA